MLFVSFTFLYVFLPVTYAGFWLLRTRSQRHVWLTATGYVFYSFWDWRFCGLMALSTVVAYAAGLGFLRFEDARRRRLCLVLPITLDLLLLGFFKYADFLAGSAARLASLLGFHAAPPLLGLVLPIGISFYTFHTITYVVDCWRRVVTPTRSFFEFSCYVSFFAQLVAGPIVRFRQIEPDLEAIDLARRRALLDPGCALFVLGLAKKVLVADGLGAHVDALLASGSPPAGWPAWLALLGYTYQIYFDFSGYSDMALGLGLLFGLHLPRNFDVPYRAAGPSDFWRRWHISLSTVLRDYLFIPMGGSRGSTARTYRNLMVTMFLGGLWHGASWTFVLWGLYHGGLLVLERAAGAARAILARREVTFLLVALGWVLFRSRSVAQAGEWFEALTGPFSAALPERARGLVVRLAVAAPLAHLGPAALDLPPTWTPLRTAGLAALFVVSLMWMASGRPSPFLYFQF